MLDIVKNNLLTNSGEFYFINGSPYEGEYHQHGDGQAMTGGVHAKDSQMIYRKKPNGELLKPRQKMSKREVMTLKKKVEKFIPSIRIKSKSYAEKQTMQKKSLQQFSKETVVAKSKIPTVSKTAVKTAPVKTTTESKIEKY